MPRIVRIVAAGYPYYFTQRENYQQKNSYYIGKATKKWKEFIEKLDNPDELKGIREKTKMGRYLESNDFTERLEG